MNSGNQRIKGLTENDIADVLAAMDAAHRLHGIHRAICFAPYVGKQRLDEMDEELRLIDAGLAVSHRVLREYREAMP